MPAGFPLLQEYSTFQERAFPYFDRQEFTLHFAITQDSSAPLIEKRFQNLLFIIQAVNAKARAIFPELPNRPDPIQGLEDFRLKLHETNWSYRIQLTQQATSLLAISLMLIPPEAGIAKP